MRRRPSRDERNVGRSAPASSMAKPRPVAPRGSPNRPSTKSDAAKHTTLVSPALRAAGTVATTPPRACDRTRHRGAAPQEQGRTPSPGRRRTGRRPSSAPGPGRDRTMHRPPRPQHVVRPSMGNGKRWSEDVARHTQSGARAAGGTVKLTGRLARDARADRRRISALWCKLSAVRTARPPPPRRCGPTSGRRAAQAPRAVVRARARRAPGSPAAPGSRRRRRCGRQASR